MSKTKVMQCMDCRKETISNDYYMVKNKVWDESLDAWAIHGVGYLCIKCLKKRMNHIALRDLKKSDFKETKDSIN